MLAAQSQILAEANLSFNKLDWKRLYLLYFYRIPCAGHGPWIWEVSSRQGTELCLGSLLPQPTTDKNVGANAHLYYLTPTPFPSLLHISSPLLQKIPLSIKVLLELLSLQSCPVFSTIINTHTVIWDLGLNPLTSLPVPAADIQAKLQQEHEWLFFSDFLKYVNKHYE